MPLLELLVTHHARLDEEAKVAELVRIIGLPATNENSEPTTRARWIAGLKSKFLQLLLGAFL